MGTAVAPLLFSAPLFASPLRRARIAPVCCDNVATTPAPAKVKFRTKRKSWAERYVQLYEYLRVHGDVHVSRKVDPGLYEWVVRQRYRWNSGDLCIEKYRQLSLLDFSWDGQFEKWKRMFYRATSYEAEHGHCNVRASEDLQLSQWIILQRYLYKRGKLCDERVRRLQGLNIVLDPLEDKFTKQIRTLKAFTEEHGHGLIPRSVAPWADALRRRWKDGNLSVRMYREYRKHGFCFQPHEYKTWVWIERFMEFKKAHGHCYPNFLDDRPLYEWTQAQRRKYRNGILHPNVHAQLVEAGMDFRPFRMVSEEIIGIMERCYKEADETDSDCARLKLEEWHTLLRKIGRKKLRKSDIERLQKIGFEFE